MQSIETYKCTNCGAPIDIKSFFGMFSCQYCGTQQRYVNYNFTDDPVILNGQIIDGTFDLVDAIREMNDSFSRKWYASSRREAAEIIRHTPNQIDAICCIIISDMHLNLEGRGVEFYRRAALDAYFAYIQADKDKIYDFIIKTIEQIIELRDLDIVMINLLIILSKIRPEDRCNILMMLSRSYRSLSGEKYTWPNAILLDDSSYLMSKICDKFGERELIETFNTYGHWGKLSWIKHDHITQKQLNYLAKLKELGIECGWTWGLKEDKINDFNFYISQSSESRLNNPSDNSNLYGFGCLMIIALIAFFPIRSCINRHNRQERIQSLTNSPGEIRIAHNRAMNTWYELERLRNSKPKHIYIQNNEGIISSETVIPKRDRIAEAEALENWRKEINRLQQGFEREKIEYEILANELANLQKQ